MNKPDTALGLTAKPSPNIANNPDLGPKGPVGPPGVPGQPGILVSGLDAPQHPPAALESTELKVKSFIILIRHITKGTLHVVARGDGAIVEFEDMEQAINTAVGIPACQRNPHFIAPVYE